MRTLVIYDSNFGNSKTIAECIAEVLQTKALTTGQVLHQTLTDLDLLIVGCPINGWRPSERMQKFLDSLIPQELQGVTTATFDTRVQLFIHGDASGKIAHALESAGAENISKHGFLVKGTHGPLLDGEIEKAKQWALSVRKLYLRKQHIPLTI